MRGWSTAAGPSRTATTRWPPPSPVSYGDLWSNREVSALTGAALAVRREVFEEVGGFSELFPVNYNDVDLSLKIRRTGRRLLWLHGVLLYHFESISRSNAVHDWEKELICRRWGDYREVPERYTSNVRAVVRASEQGSDDE